MFYIIPTDKKRPMPFIPLKPSEIWEIVFLRHYL